MNKHIEALREQMTNREARDADFNWDRTIEDAVKFVNGFRPSDEAKCEYYAVKLGYDDVAFNKKKVQGIFEGVGFDVKKMWQLENKYWPDAYVQLRLDNPWWLVKTDMGLIEIGPRKRVISIDWAETGFEKVVTDDEVTKDKYYVHAYSEAKAFEYLSALYKAWKNG